MAPQLSHMVQGTWYLLRATIILKADLHSLNKKHGIRICGIKLIIFFEAGQEITNVSRQNELSSNLAIK